MQFLAGFALSRTIPNEILQRLANPASTGDAGETAKRQATLEERLRRMRDLYELGDLPRPEYVARRDAIHAELSSLAPGPIPDIDQASKVLQDFTLFWKKESDPANKRQVLSLIFDGIWLDDGRVVAVQPKPSFLPFFENKHEEATGRCRKRERRDSNPRPLP